MFLSRPEPRPPFLFPLLASRAREDQHPPDSKEHGDDERHQHSFCNALGQIPPGHLREDARRRRRWARRRRANAFVLVDQLTEAGGGGLLSLGNRSTSRLACSSVSKSFTPIFCAISR